MFPGIEGKEPAFPSIPMKRSEGSLTSTEVRPSGKTAEQTKNPISSQLPPCSARTAFLHKDTPVHEAARGVFLVKQPVAHCNPNFSRVKEIRKGK